MKRILLLSLLLLSALAGKAWSEMGPYGQDHRPAMWRSSRTATADNFVLISTGPIHFHGIVISSPTLNIADSRLIIYNSTSARVMSVGASTAVIVNLNETLFNDSGTTEIAMTFSPVPREKIQYDLYLSSGLAYDKRGLAEINILWDYVAPKKDSPDRTFEAQ